MDIGAGLPQVAGMDTPDPRRSIWWNAREPSLADLTRLGAGSMPGHIGIEFVAVGGDWLAARMPVDARTCQPFRRLHGGASVALAETVGSVAAACAIDPERFVAVGMEINANHIRPAYSGWVTATARPEAIGRTTHVWSIRLEDEGGRLVAVSRLTVAVIAKERT
ncbi:MAG: hotdog fold thioesterase [Novosphingobium sp.]